MFPIVFQCLFSLPVRTLCPAITLYMYFIWCVCPFIARHQKRNEMKSHKCHFGVHWTVLLLLMCNDKFEMRPMRFEITLYDMRYIYSISHCAVLCCAIHTQFNGIQRIGMTFECVHFNWIIPFDQQHSCFTLTAIDNV